MQNTENKSKKFVVLATYVVAVLCLLAGFFVPLFAGNDILALKLADVFKSLLNKGTGVFYPVNLFGIEKLYVDFGALVLVLYLVVTVLALLSFIPVALSLRNEGKLAKKFYYGIEIAAIIVLSLFFIITLGNSSVSYTMSYNMVIAICGTVLALLVLSGMDKGKTAVIKIVLFILSAIGFLALFDFIGLVLSDEAYLSFMEKSKLHPLFVQSSIDASIDAIPFYIIGVEGLDSLFNANISTVLSNLPDAKAKALLVLAAVTATVVLLNFFIDVIKLATKKDRKVGRIFDISRYGLELVTAVGTLATTLIAKDTIGILLVVILAVAAIQLLIAIIRFVTGMLQKSDKTDFNERVTVEDEIIHDPVIESFGAEEFRQTPAEPVYDDDGYTAPTEDDFKTPEYVDDYVNPEDDIAAEPVTEEITEVTEPDGATVEEPAAEQTDIPAEEVTAETSAEEITEETKPEEVIDDDYYKPDIEGTYLLPADAGVDDKPAETVEEVVEETEPETVEEPAVEEPETETETATEETTALQPVTEETATETETVTDNEVEEPAVEEPEVKEEPVQKPYPGEIKPYNPYERHNNNPFRNYEQSSHSVQPYNPYAQQTAKPAQPAFEKPARPVQEQKPVQPFKPAERPQVKPLQPRPIIQEFKPVPPVSEQPKEPMLYTIDAIYAGPLDDFIRKLTNDERIEFARTFIEKNRGDLGNIPDYVVGGNNKKFFSVSFIYLGRIRGLVSDGLLNKMYKELNML